MNDIGNIASDQLRSIVERIERLNEEEKAIKTDKKEVYAEAKSVGYCTKTLRKVVTLRGLEDADRQEQESMLDLYMHALGMVPATHADDAGEGVV